MKQEINIKNLSKEQQAIYRNFKEQYPRLVSSFKDFYLKYTHLGAQYQIKLDGSDDSLLELLPPEPSTPTAAQVAVKFHQDGNLEATAFKVLLPCIIYDFADPQSGRLPQCNQINAKKLTKFESLVAETRKCITGQQQKHDNTNICKDLVMMQTQIAHYDGTYDEIAAPALDFLNILGLTVFPDFSSDQEL